MHYHIHVACPCKIPIKYTNKQNLERDYVGMAFPLEKALVSLVGVQVI